MTFLPDGRFVFTFHGNHTPMTNLSQEAPRLARLSLLLAYRRDRFWWRELSNRTQRRINDNDVIERHLDLRKRNRSGRNVSEQVLKQKRD
tara:strand:- start:740 stop:1009 length:270 start_codon:yes stop_codon:yes gene_type:complete